MRIVRVQVGGGAVYGVLEGDTVKEIRGSIYGGYQVTDKTHRLADVELLVPCEPTKLLAMARNYQSHVRPAQTPTKPELFFKTVSALLPHEGTIVIPKEAGKADYEGELVAVIGKRAKNVSKEEALSYVLGYTCGNDVSVREWQDNDTQWWR
ncbi:MAG: fumarylacetoacetate hydrolase family protein, partial [Chloroflexi bacterium]|nr:fumarylacetoacetate hydrolase family protein [Chloroflexota bacterium]